MPLALAAGYGHAEFVPAPCDVTTAVNGWVFGDSPRDPTKSQAPKKVDFRISAECKAGAPSGQVSGRDHRTNDSLTSTRITGYLMDPAVPKAREICGEGLVNDAAPVRFRARVEDNGDPGGLDRFGIRLSDGYYLPTRELGHAGMNGGGGNVQFAQNPDSPATGPSLAQSEAEMCGDLMSP
jgi:hypothetical protein